MRKQFKGINITSIKTLQKKLASILKNYILDDGNIHPYAILHKNMNEFKNFNFQNLDSLIVKDFPEISVINEYLNEELYDSKLWITDDKIHFYIEDYSEYYLKSELSNLIFNHNKNLLIPGSSKYLVEK